jgi:hypothetical protein
MTFLKGGEVLTSIAIWREKGLQDQIFMGSNFNFIELTFCEASKG